METGLFFVLGLVLGSFANAVLWRLEKEKDILVSRSECTRCGHKLGFFDLIPLLSFLFLKGRCRYCRKKISWQYPAVELFFGLGVLFIYLYSRDIAESIFLTGVFLATFLIFIYDLRFLIIPDVLVLTGLIWVLLGKFWFFRGDVKIGFLTGLSIFVFFFLMRQLSKGKWVGGGDAKLGFILGLWLGWPLGFLGLFLAYVIGAAVGVGLMALKKVTLKSQVPFGPFLITGAWVAYSWGNEILKWYENFLTIG